MVVLENKRDLMIKKTTSMITNLDILIGNKILRIIKN